MTVLLAFKDGMRRVTAAPAVLAGVFLLTVLLALPLGLVLDSMIRASLGSSLAADTAASGVNFTWWQEFMAQATGLGITFTPRVLGLAPTLDAVSGILDNIPRPAVINGVGMAYALLWLFLVGGILDRYARNRPIRTAAFFAACGVYFTRFLRLALAAAVVYTFLFAVVHPWLFDRLYPWATRDWTVERNAFLLRLSLYLLFGLLLSAVNLWFDYAKIRAVVEDRRSMIGALGAAGRFLRSMPGATAGLYLLDGAVFVVLVALYGLVAPGAGSAGWGAWVGFAISEAYILARIWVKLLFYASQTALFQRALAHDDYTAATLPVWPDSPAAEAIPPGGRD
jgi:hypothetical protein